MRFQHPRMLDLALMALLGAVTVVVFQRILDHVFFHDDWTLLARAAGLLPHPDVPVRWLGFDLYWRFMHGVWGLQANAYTISRIVLHLATGAAVMSVASRIAPLRRAGALIAGVIYLLTPLAFEPLFWAAGVTELLATLGLVAALDGALRGGRAGLALFLASMTVSLLSKETGWWLPLVSFAVWWRRRDPAWLGATVAAGALAVATLAWTARGLSHDYAWSFAAVPWSIARAGSWILTRPQDLVQVWEASGITLALGTLIWLIWVAWGWWSWRRGQRWPAAALVAALLSLAPVVGLSDHLVPRYLLPVQACLAIGLAATLSPRLPRPRLVFVALVVTLGLYTHWCLHEVMTRRFSQGRPAHRLVAKELMVRLVWKTLGEAGVGAGTDLAFLERPGDDTKARDYLLDVIGRSWGPRLLLGQDSDVVIVDRPEDVPVGAAAFGFRGWKLEFLGVRRPRGRQ